MVNFHFFVAEYMWSHSCNSSTKFFITMCKKAYHLRYEDGCGDCVSLRIQAWLGYLTYDPLCYMDTTIIKIWYLIPSITLQLKTKLSSHPICLNFVRLFPLFNAYSPLANRLDKDGSKVLVSALFVSIEWFVMSCKENQARMSLRFQLTQIFIFS